MGFEKILSASTPKVFAISTFFANPIINLKSPNSLLSIVSNSRLSSICPAIKPNLTIGPAIN